ncbi:NAD(P)-dependent oxidoreductase [Nonomuraea lactucae]|uniref:NAD(P)-dependent oxidoreductase n=1 Tax=Nonomuraea lactucae TaxID=2249762 RepID=UPI000DE3B57E|nr:NAD(P)-dependent oxidoreductase [Nonomuraea lactucae]
MTGASAAERHPTTGAIGFVGPGAMGGRMAARLLAGGHRVVVYARSPAKVARLREAGATLAGTPAEVAAATDVVCGCLLDSAAVSEVYLGAEGLLKAARPGQILVEHATFDPQLSRRIAAAATRIGAAFLDAPVTGGPEGAEHGELVAMAGGDRSAFDAVRPVLAAYTREAVYVGGPGRGLELKLVNQLLVGCHAAAAAEASALLRGLEIPRETAERVLLSGWGAGAMLARVLPRAYDRDYDSEATVAGLDAVFDLVAALLDRQGIEARLFPAGRAAFAAALAGGDGDRDISVVAEYYAEEHWNQEEPRETR